MSDRPAAERLAWLLEHAGPGKVTADEVEDMFAADFLAQVSPDRIVGFLAGLELPAEYAAEELSSSAHSISVRLQVDDVALRLSLAVEPTPPHRITGLGASTGPTLVEALDAEPPSGTLPAVVAEVLGPVVAPFNAGGMAVGVARGGDEYVTALGDVAADAVFDIGSIAKPFTGIVLASMVDRGDVALDDPVARFLPSGTRMPDDDGRPITLVDLATHASGLPREPRGFAPADPQNPFADFTVEKLYDGLANTTLDFAIGSRTQYSNFGFGLLAHTLGLAAGVPYEQLIEERVCEPLGMTSTTARARPADMAGLAPGYAENGEPTPWWDAAAILGAGGIRSTVADLLRFARANLDPSSTPIGTALDLAQQPRIQESASDRMQIGLGWVVLDRLDGSAVVWHNGGTYGFRSFLAFHRPSGSAIVALVNRGGTDHDAVALQVLTAAIAGADF